MQVRPRPISAKTTPNWSAWRWKHRRAIHPGRTTETMLKTREVLRFIAEGGMNKDIANQLSLSVYTVEGHRGRLMEKLNLHSTGDLVRFAIRNGFIS